MVVDWEQETGLLMTSGDVRIIRIWDTDREMKVQVTPASSCWLQAVSYPGTAKASESCPRRAGWFWSPCLSASEPWHQTNIGSVSGLSWRLLVVFWAVFSGVWER